MLLQKIFNLPEADFRRLWKVLLELTQGLDIQTSASSTHVTFSVAWSIASALGGTWAATVDVWRRRQPDPVGIPTRGLSPLLQTTAQERLRQVLTGSLPRETGLFFLPGGSRPSE